MSAVLVWFGLESVPGARADETIHVCGGNPNNVFYESDAFGFQEGEDCTTPGTGEIMGIYESGGAKQGADAYWEAAAPAGLLIDQLTAGGMNVYNVNGPSPYGGGFFWGPGNSDGPRVLSGQTTAGPYNASNQPGFPSADVGFQLVCGQSSCPNDSARWWIGSLQLSVEETVGPSILGGGLWNHTGWVRGTWPISVSGDSPSGVCSLSATISGDPSIASASMPPNQTLWHQCDESLQGSLNTTYAANGSNTLHLSLNDAAGLSHSVSTTVEVDNQTPMVSFSGPSTALSTAGTQYVTADVNTGPSGAYGADCSVDGGASTFYAGANPQVPVNGIGPHTITCTGLNNAVNANGQRGSSTAVSTTLDIQQPTEEAITFSKIADELKCRRVVKRVRVLGKPHTIRRHGRKIRVVRRYHTVKRQVRQCKARTVKRRVLVPLKRRGKVVRRHGKIVRVKRTERIVLLPHRVHKTVRRIKHGHRTTVSGLLLTSSGTPLAGQTITVMAAPNDANPQFAPMSTAVTNANGYWIGKVTRGPSRLIEAVYGGSATTAGTTSTTVRLVVPAKLRILSHTARVAWGHTASFRGRVYGGYIPRGGINVRLRYGYRRQSITYGVKTHVGPRGRFRTRFTFGQGDPRDHIRFHFQFATLPGGNYPYHTAKSNTVSVRVGGHPRPRRHHPRHRRHRRR